MRWSRISGALMICKSCMDAADGVLEIIEVGCEVDQFVVSHCDDIGCSCQHKPIGSWKGDVE